MSSRVVPAAASCLLAGLLDEGADLVEVARTRVSVHYETGRADVPVLCVCTPDAVRLPGSVVTPVVPSGGGCGPGTARSSARPRPGGWAGGGSRPGRAG